MVPLDGRRLVLAPILAAPARNSLPRENERTQKEALNVHYGIFVQLLITCLLRQQNSIRR